MAARAVLESKPGTGSTFTLRLPPVLATPSNRRTARRSRRPTQPTGIAPTAVLDPHAAIAGHQRSTVTRVLIVEDEESMADPLAFLLRREGFNTRSPATGPEALPSSTGPAPTSCCWT